MSNNKKNKPATAKSVAGKSNSKKNTQKQKQKQRAQAEKNAQRIIDEKKKEQKMREKRSEEIRKNRAKEKERQRKAQIAANKKAERRSKFRNFGDVARFVWEKIKYYTSKEFLSSFNYVRIFIFIVLPVLLIVFGISALSKAVVFNVPAEIRQYEFNSRLESETVAKESVFNAQQKQVFTDAINSSGSKKFSFYINSVIPVDDDCKTYELCFGNTSEENTVLVASIYDSGGNVIYRSLGLESGKEINEAKLFENLSYGLHSVKVAVNAYDKETNEKIGTRYARIKLAVGVDENGE